MVIYNHILYAYLHPLDNSWHQVAVTVPTVVHQKSQPKRVKKKIKNSNNSSNYTIKDVNDAK